MERYETAAIELVTLEEDVITASGTNSTTAKTVDHCSDYSPEHVGNWTIYYTDGTTESQYGSKPSVCP